MVVLLTTGYVWSRYGDEIRRFATEGGISIEALLLPPGEDARLSQEDVDRIDIAFFSADVWMGNMGRAFFAAVQGAPNLKWMQTFNAGVDGAVFGRIKASGTRLTTASGSTAVPIAQTTIAGLLMLSRRMPHYALAQQRREWDRVPDAMIPADLSTQTLTVFGMGAIGGEIARLGQALGLHVIGVRRSPQKPGDPVDEMVHPEKLDDVLPRSQWLALASPLTDETRRVLNARTIALLPRGAYVLNIARGEVIDEAAMIEALRSGHLAGAFLDVFEQEPLPGESPLWEMPNVIVTPHNSSISTGNEARVMGYFLRNLRAWGSAAAMENEV